MINKFLKDEKGLSAILILIVGTIVLTIGSSYILQTMYSESVFTKEYKDVQTKLLAESAFRKVRSVMARKGVDQLRFLNEIEMRVDIIDPFRGDNSKRADHTIVCTVYTEYNFETKLVDESTNKEETIIYIDAFTKKDRYGSTNSKNRDSWSSLVTTLETSNLAGYLWFTDNNFALRGLPPGEFDDNDSYFTYRDVFDGRVHSNTDIWLQERGSDTVDDGFENFAGSGYWAVFLKETKTAGHFTGATTYPNDYDPDDILSDDLMDDIMETDVAPLPYEDGWTAPWKDEAPAIEFLATAERVRRNSRVKLNQSNRYAVVRAKLDGGIMRWQGGRADTVSDNTVLMQNVYDPWNINKPNDRDTIPILTVGMINDARRKYKTSAMGQDHIRNTDHFLSPWVYEYVVWEPTEVSQIPTNGSIFVEGELWIEGMVNLNCSIGASGNIRLTGNIGYEGEALDPLSHFSSPDDRFRGAMELEENLFNTKRVSLGLISEEKIIVGYTPANYGVYFTDLGQAQQIDGGITIFAGLVAAGDDEDPGANTYEDGMFTFEMWHPPADNPVWGETFKHMLGNSNSWFSFYPVDLDQDGDVDIMLDWNNPRDIQHLFYYEPHLSGNNGWLMHPDLIGSNPYSQAGFQAGHYTYQGWEWDDEWQKVYGILIPNLKNRGTIHLCGALAQRVRGHSRRTPFEPSEGGSNGNGGSFEDYDDDSIQNGYNRDYVYDQRFHVRHLFYNPPPNYPKAQVRGEQIDDDNLPYFFRAPVIDD